MLFNSLTFIVFFVLVLALHNAPLSWSTKKTNLLIASYLFYAAWNPPFVILLWISTVIDWHVAKRLFVEKARSRRRMLLAVSVVVNLGLLGYFKYIGFFAANAMYLARTLGFEPSWMSLEVILPVGISFYTFQSMSYTIDVYRRALPATRSATDFALFVAFFPTLVAGPIVRARDFLPQLDAWWAERRTA